MSEFSTLKNGQMLGPDDAIISSVAQVALNSARRFKDDYLQLSRSMFESRDVKNGLSHAGEFGRFREKLLQSFLKQFLPARLAVGDGFLVPFLERRSTQCDAIIYDRDTSPQLESPGGLVMFPPEVCAAVGEVKSKLSFDAAKEALAKLSAAKKVRHDMTVYSLPVAPTSAVVIDRERFLAIDREYDDYNSGSLHRVEAVSSLYTPDKIEEQALVTFLVCEEIEFPAPDPDRSEKANFDRSIKELIRSAGRAHLRQNFILSLNQGFLSYFFSIPDESGDNVRAIPYPYPVQTVKRIHGTNDDLPTDCGLRWLPANDDHRHIMQFASELAIAVSRVPIYPFSPHSHALDPKAYSYEFFTGP